MICVFVLAGAFFASARSVYAYTAQQITSTVLDTSNNHSHGIQSVEMRNVRFQGVLPDNIIELTDGTYHYVNSVDWEMDMVYNRVEAAYEYVDRYLVFDTDIIITPAYTSGVQISNVQIEFYNITPNVYIVSAPYVSTSSQGAFTYKFRTSVYCINAQTTLTSSTTKARLKLADYKVTFNYQTDRDDNYCQVQTSVRNDYVSGYLRAYESGNPAAYNENISVIVDALAESGDVDQIINLLTASAGSEAQIYTILANDFPLVLQDLTNMLTLQSTTNLRLGQLYGLLEQWYDDYSAMLQQAETVESRLESKVEDASSQVAQIGEDMSYPTVDPSGVGDDAIDIAINQQGSQSSQFLWINQGIIPSLLLIAVTFAVIGFILYGRG